MLAAMRLRLAIRPVLSARIGIMRSVKMPLRTPWLLPQRHYTDARPATSTLGPDATNPTTVTQPVRDRTGQVLRVNMTTSAATKLHRIAAEDNRPNIVLRIHVESGGCHGFQYIFQLQDDKEITAGDSVFKRDGARVVIDHKSMRILRDSTVDYSTELIGSQFRVTSPHTSSACGCGSSFSLDEEP